MTAPEVFIGLVSHTKSRFAFNQGERGPAKALGQELHNRGVTVEVRINTHNRLDTATFPLTPRMSVDSVAGELTLERRWHAFLGGKKSARFTARMAVRRAKLALDRLQGGNTAVVERLLNIEYSHVDLMKAGVESGAAWILILEDDAGARDMAALAELIEYLVRTDVPPQLVSLSESFTLDELGIAHLLHPHGPQDMHLFRCDRPVTNTVCAIAYRRDFLEKLVAELQALPVEPIVPIDWRVNEALMSLWDRGVIGAGDCWLTDPAPIVQLSMHDLSSQDHQ